MLEERWLAQPCPCDREDVGIQAHMPLHLEKEGEKEYTSNKTPTERDVPQTF